VQLENSFTVPVPIDDAWRVLLDIERIAPCMPGAALDSVDGDDFTGRVKVKLGPINLTYQGKASFIEKDEAAHRAVIDAKGKDQRGNGTAAAVITANLTEEGSTTLVNVVTDLNITGRPAQFGRGVMTDVGNKLLGQFADKLSAQLAMTEEEAAVDREAAARKQEPTVAGAAAGAAATATGAVEEVAASAEAAEGEGAAAQAARKAGAATKKAAAAATEKVTATEKVPAKAAKAPAKKAPAAKAPSAPPAGTTAPPTRPATGAPERVVPAAARPAARPQVEPEPIDLLEVAGGAAMTRLALPAAGIAAVIAVIVLLLRRRRRR
jgi:carbon monoxide dehydrogenase subunit G